MLAVERDEHILEINSIGKYAQHRHNNVVRQRTHNLAESCADDNTNGQIEHIALGDKLLEFGNKTHATERIKGERK